MTEGQRLYLNTAIRAVIVLFVVSSLLLLMKWHGIEQRQAGWDECVTTFLEKGFVVRTPAEAVAIPISDGRVIRLWTEPMVSGSFHAEILRKGEFEGWAIVRFKKGGKDDVLVSP